MFNITTAEELLEYLSEEDQIDIRDLKLLRYYSALAGNQEIVQVIDSCLEKVYDLSFE